MWKLHIYILSLFKTFTGTLRQIRVSVDEWVALSLSKDDYSSERPLTRIPMTESGAFVIDRESAKVILGRSLETGNVDATLTHSARRAPGCIAT